MNCFLSGIFPSQQEILALARAEKYAKFWKKVLDFFRRMRIIKFVREIEDLCNGSTPDSDSVCGGSNPSSSANKKSHPFGWLFLLAEDENGFERAAPVRTLFSPWENPWTGERIRYGCGRRFIWVVAAVTGPTPLCFPSGRMMQIESLILR